MNVDFVLRKQKQGESVVSKQACPLEAKKESFAATPPTGPPAFHTEPAHAAMPEALLAREKKTQLAAPPPSNIPLAPLPQELHVVRPAYYYYFMLMGADIPTNTTPLQYQQRSQPFPTVASESRIRATADRPRDGYSTAAAASDGCSRLQGAEADAVEDDGPG